MDNTQADKYSEAVSAILRREYKASGLSYSTLADRTGLGRATVERVINGKREATALYLYLLCEVFGTTPGAVMSEADSAG